MTAMRKRSGSRWQKVIEHTSCDAITGYASTVYATARSERPAKLTTSSALLMAAAMMTTTCRRYADCHADKTAAEGGKASKGADRLGWLAQ